MIQSKLRFSNAVSNYGKRCKHWHSLESQYWQRSKMPTMHFQASLPRLPVPELEKTCERYLAAQRPLLTEDAYKKTETNVKQFKETVGKTLQQILIAKDKKNKHTSYITEPWFDMYLRDRKPIPISYNPMLVFLNDDRQEYNNQLIKTANVLISSLRFYKSLQDNILEPEVFHLNPKKSDTRTFRSICSKIPPAFSWYAAYLFNAYPLDMSQYHNLFNSTRIPQTSKDVIYTNHKAKHVLVQYKGHFYVFDVLDENNYILEPSRILGNLKMILHNTISACEFPLGVLTTLDRDEWANIRNHLQSLGNEEVLNLLDSALFNICLDEIVIGTEPVPLCRNFVHGDGKNRWFDKSISLIVSKDGVAGINFEHSWGDGVAVLRFFNDIHKDSIQNPQVHPDTKSTIETNNVRKLDFFIDEKMKNAIQKARTDYEKTCNSLEFGVLQMEGLGRKFCKKFHVSPDAIMQLGFQVAYHKLTGQCAASYESCSTAAFKHGRTEAIRPCTTATKTYSIAVQKQSSPNSLLKKLISDCSTAHGQLTKEAAMGQGFDRHLFVLKLLSTSTSSELPTIFQDPAYANINHNIISTSTLASPSLWAGGFGPVVSDGYGIGYTIKDDALGVLVTTYPPARNSNDFVQALEQSYKEIIRILQNNNK